MFNVFKRNKKETKLYRVIKVYNIWTETEEIIDEVFDKLAVNNMVVNGYEIIEMEEVK